MPRPDPGSFAARKQKRRARSDRMHGAARSKEQDMDGLDMNPQRVMGVDHSDSFSAQVGCLCVVSPSIVDDVINDVGWITACTPPSVHAKETRSGENAAFQRAIIRHRP